MQLKLLEKKLLEEEFKETANIFVTVKLAGLRFTAYGEVGSPGTTTLYQERVNVFEALANSGDEEPQSFEPSDSKFVPVSKCVT